MFSYQTVVAFLVFIAGLIFLFSYVKRGVRLVKRVTVAWVNYKVIGIFNKALAAKKEKIFSSLDESISHLGRPLKVVEIGAGGGANFKYLPKNTELVCVEPNEYAKKYFFANANKFPEVKVKEFHVGVAENMSFIAAESVDAVVCTLVLCSVTDVEQTLREIFRILKKGGKLIFVEHTEAVVGRSDEHWQHVFKHFWHLFAGGHGHTKHLDTEVFIKNAGFDKTSMEIFDADFSHAPLLLRPFLSLAHRQCAGVAIK